MPKSITRVVEALLLLTIISSLFLGVTWASDSPAKASEVPPLGTPAPAELTAVAATALPQAVATISDTLGLDPVMTATVRGPLATPVAFDTAGQTSEAGDAQLIEQTAGTINILLMGTDAAGDKRYARTDSLMIASINPDGPSVSLLSFPRDLLVHIPGAKDDRINTVFEQGSILNYPGGGPAFVALMLRKNFGIKIDHFVRIDFQGFVKAVDTLGGVEVLAECELHDTFPDPANPKSKKGIDLDVFPGKVELTGWQALWFSRSRYSTTDFDRARRQQKVIRAILSKARQKNLLPNAIGLYADFREYIDTDLGLTDLPKLVDIAQRLGDISIKSSVITWPIVKNVKRADGAAVLGSTGDTIPFIEQALSPPSGNRAQTPIAIEVYNGSSKPDMELVAAERLTWEGFQVVARGVTSSPEFKTTQIIDFGTVPKGSPVARLAKVFGVSKENIIGQPDPSSGAAARVILGDDYNSCPNTAGIAGDVQLAPNGKSTPAP